MRSKALLVSNILATLYSATLLWIFGGAIIEAGGLDYIGYWQQYFDLVFELAGFSATAEIVDTYRGICFRCGIWLDSLSIKEKRFSKICCNFISYRNYLFPDICFLWASPHNHWFCSRRKTEEN